MLCLWCNAHLSIDLLKIGRRWIPNVVGAHSYVHKRINKDVSEQNTQCVYVRTQVEMQYRGCFTRRSLLNVKYIILIYSLLKWISFFIHGVFYPKQSTEEVPLCISAHQNVQTINICPTYVCTVTCAVCGACNVCILSYCGLNSSSVCGAHNVQFHFL